MTKNNKSIVHWIKYFLFVAVAMTTFGILFGNIVYSQETTGGKTKSDFQFLFEPYLMFTSINLKIG